MFRCNSMELCKLVNSLFNSNKLLRDCFSIAWKHDCLISNRWLLRWLLFFSFFTIFMYFPSFLHFLLGCECSKILNGDSSSHSYLLLSSQGEGFQILPLIILAAVLEVFFFFKHNSMVNFVLWFLSISGDGNIILSVDLLKCVVSFQNVSPPNNSCLDSTNLFMGL